MNSHEIDYKIIGHDIQLVEVELDPYETVIAEAGAMMYMEDGIKMDTIFGDGKALRDYIYVADVAEANALALTRGAGEIINVGSETGTSVGELYAHLKKLIGFHGEAKFAPLRPGEIQQIFLSGRKAKQVLGWSPNMTVEQGLNFTVDWTRQVKAGGPWRS